MYLESCSNNIQCSCSQQPTFSAPFNVELPAWSVSPPSEVNPTGVTLTGPSITNARSGFRLLPGHLASRSTDDRKGWFLQPAHRKPSCAALPCVCVCAVAMASATGFTEEYINENIGTRLVVVASVFIGLEICVVALRFFARYKYRTQWGLDDYLMAPALLFCLGTCVIGISESHPQFLAAYRGTTH